MRIIIICFIIFGLNISVGMAATGKILFTGSVTEPACVTNVIEINVAVRCPRRARTLQIKYSAGELNSELPYQLEMVTQNDRNHRREITIIYR
ncbi:TPA: hypothetical protein QFT01_002970 [Enterobacter cloacae]|nr:hypothetical protein [Enterobacter cloacae]